MTFHTTPNHLESDLLEQLVCKPTGHERVDDKLNKLLTIMRDHLGMNVAFISQFVDGKRVFRFIDSNNNSAAINVGDSDPLEETYCKKIVDRNLDGIILDTHENNITRNLAVTEKLSIGSYMGAPIRLSNGEVYGTFCCYKESADSTLNERDFAFLQAACEITSVLIEKNITTEKFRDVCSKRIQSVLNTEKHVIYYQPVFNLQTQGVVGYESLSRFFTDPYRTPDVWFDEASKLRLGVELEVSAIEKALKGLEYLNSSHYITVNTSPETILSGHLETVLANLDAKRVVLEITEHSPVQDYEALREALAPLRKKGALLAIDDAGAGYASFQHVLELQADIIKLDLSLTQNIHSQPRKFLLAKALCAFAKSINCRVIAEGVETKAELNSLKELAVDSVQGFLLGRPSPIEDVLNIS